MALQSARGRSVTSSVGWIALEAHSDQPPWPEDSVGDWRPPVVDTYARQQIVRTTRPVREIGREHADGVEALTELSNMQRCSLRLEGNWGGVQAAQRVWTVWVRLERG
jgi:hypothetical protein